MVKKWRSQDGINITDYFQLTRSQLATIELSFIFYFIRMDYKKINESLRRIRKQIQRHDLLQQIREDKLMNVTDSTFQSNLYNVLSVSEV